MVVKALEDGCGKSGDAAGAGGGDKRGDKRGTVDIKVKMENGNGRFEDKRLAQVSE